MAAENKAFKEKGIEIGRVDGIGVPDEYVTYGPPVRLCGSQYACAQCSAYLDDDGLFPEEREELELVDIKCNFRSTI